MAREKGEPESGEDVPQTDDSGYAELMGADETQTPAVLTQAGGFKVDDEPHVESTHSIEQIPDGYALLVVPGTDGVVDVMLGVHVTDITEISSDAGVEAKVAAHPGAAGVSIVSVKAPKGTESEVAVTVRRKGAR